jgi:hypothetical protein
MDYHSVLTLEIVYANETMHQNKRLLWNTVISQKLYMNFTEISSFFTRKNA